MKKNIIAILLIFCLMLSGCASETPDAEDAQVGYKPPEVVGNAVQTGDKEILPEEDTSTALPQSDEDDQEDAPAEDTQPETQEETPAEQPETPEEKEPVTYEDGNKLKIVDYNVRCKDDGVGKTIEERSIRFEAVMEKYDPDIMGLQEVVPRWLQYLEESFGDDYGYINQWRASSSQESTPIFWKKDKFQLMDSGHFWLSDTPKRESKAESWGADYYRICMWVKLKIKSTGKEFLFFNTHFDFDSTCHVNSAELIIREAVKQKGFSKYAVFCTGDYNMRPQKEGYKAMCERFKDINYELGNDTTPTTNGYNESDSGSIIDFCFYSPDLVAPLKYQVLNEYIYDGYVSDHRGLYIEAALL